MFEVLIAEDNALIRRGIISAIAWEQNNCHLLAEAENGRHAIELIERQPPNIVVTDIKMPVTDGLALLDYLSAHYPHIRTIVISGYDNFDYVHHALQRGSVDYLLKPIRREEINRAIAHACDAIREKQKQNVPDYMISTLLFSALDGNYPASPADIPSFAQSIVSTASFCTVLFQAPRQSHPLIGQMVRKGLDAVCDTQIYERAHMDETLFLIILKSPEQYAALARAIDRLAQSIGDALGQTLAFGVSQLCPDFFQLHFYRFQACIALQQHFLRPHQRVFLWKPAPETTPLLFPNLETTLLHALLAGDLNRARELCTETLYRITQSPDSQVSDLNTAIMQIYYIMLKTHATDCTKILAEINRFSVDYLLHFHDLDEICVFLCELCRPICNEALSRQRDSLTLLDDIKSYIDDHFSEHISLQTLSEIFHLSTPYLSQCFKKRYGYGLNRYLRNLRIQAARHLLSQTDARLNSICTQCGFQDYVHFSKVFKEETGLSPSEYRKNVSAHVENQDPR